MTSVIDQDGVGVLTKEDFEILKNKGRDISRTAYSASGVLLKKVSKTKIAKNITLKH